MVNAILWHGSWRVDKTISPAIFEDLSIETKQKLKDYIELRRKYKDIKANQEEKRKNAKVTVTRNPYMKWLIITFIICIFTGLLTPIKDTPYVYMYKSIKGNTMNFIAEHQPVVLIYDFSLLAILIVTAILTFSNKVKLRCSDVFMLGRYDNTFYNIVQTISNILYMYNVYYK